MKIGNYLRDLYLSDEKTVIIGKGKLIYLDEEYTFTPPTDEEVEEAFTKAIHSLEKILEPDKKWYQFWKNLVKKSV